MKEENAIDAEWLESWGSFDALKIRSEDSSASF